MRFAFLGKHEEQVCTFWRSGTWEAICCLIVVDSNRSISILFSISGNSDKVYYF